MNIVDAICEALEEITGERPIVVQGDELESYKRGEWVKFPDGSEGEMGWLDPARRSYLNGLFKTAFMEGRNPYVRE